MRRLDAVIAKLSPELRDGPTGRTTNSRTTEPVAEPSARADFSSSQRQAMLNSSSVLPAALDFNNVSLTSTHSNRATASSSRESRPQRANGLPSQSALHYNPAPFTSTASSHMNAQQERAQEHRAIDGPTRRSMPAPSGPVASVWVEPIGGAGRQGRPSRAQSEYTDSYAAERQRRTDVQSQDQARHFETRAPQASAAAAASEAQRAKHGGPRGPQGRSRGSASSTVPAPGSRHERQGGYEILVPVSVPMRGRSEVMPLQIHLHMEGAGGQGQQQGQGQGEEEDSYRGEAASASSAMTGSSVELLHGAQYGRGGAERRQGEAKRVYAALKASSGQPSQQHRRALSPAQRYAANAAATAAADESKLSLPVDPRAVQALATQVVRTDSHFQYRERYVRLQTAWLGWLRVCAEERPSGQPFTSNSAAAWVALRLVRLCWSVNRTNTRQPIFAQREHAMKHRQIAYMSSSERMHQGLLVGGRGKSSTDVPTRAREIDDGRLSRETAGNVAGAAAGRGRRYSHATSVGSSVLGEDAELVRPAGRQGGLSHLARPQGGRPRRNSMDLLETRLAGSPNRQRSSSIDLPFTQSVLYASSAGSSNVGVGGRRINSAAVPQKSLDSVLNDLDWEAERTAVATGVEQGLSLALHRPMLYTRAVAASAPAHLRMCFGAWAHWVKTKRSMQRRHSRAVCARVFGPWRAHVQWQKVLQAQGGALAQLPLRIALRRAFAQWKSGTEQKRQQERLSAQVFALNKALERLVCEPARRHVRAWQSLASSRRTARKGHKQLQAVAARAIHCLQNRALTHLLRRWQEFAQTRRYNKHLLSSAVSRMQNVAQYRCIEAWRAVVRGKRELKSKAGIVLQRWKNKLLSSAFRALAGRLDEKKRMQALGMRAALGVRNGKMRSALSAWRAHHDEKKEYKAKLAKAVGRMRNAALSTAFQAWAALSGEKKALSALCKKAALGFQNAKLRSALSAWHAHSAERKEYRALLAKAVARIRNAALSSAFQGWVAYMREKHALKDTAHRAVRALTHGRLFSAVGRWRENAAARKDARVRLQRAMALWQSATLSRCFSALGVHAGNRKAWSLFCAQAAAAVERKRIVSAVHSWKGWAVRTSVMRHFLAVTQSKRREASLSVYFEAWRVYVKKCHAIKSGTVAFAAWKESTAARRLLSTWRHAAKVQQATRAAVNRMRSQTVTQCFQGWKKHTRHCHAVRDATETARQNVFSKRAGAAVRLWRTVSGFNQLQRRVVARWRGAYYETAFRAWAQWAHRRAYVRHQQEKAAEAIRRRRAAAAVKSWVHFARLSRAYGSIFGKHATRTCAAVLSGWSRWVDRKKAIRTAGYTLSARVRTRQLSDAVAAWRKDSTVGKAERVKLLWAVRTLRMGCLGRCMSAWAGWAREAAVLHRKQAQVEALHTNRQLIAAVRHWRRECSSTVPKGPRTIAKFLRKMHAARLGEVVAAWRSKTAHSRAVAEVASEASRYIQGVRLTLSVRRWHTWADGRARTRQLESTVLPQVEVAVGALKKRAAWNAWLLAASEAQAGRAHVLAFRNTCFAALAVHARQKRAWRALTEGAQVHLLAVRAAAMVRRWRGAAQYKQALRSATEAVEATQLQRLRRSGYEAWLAWYLRRKQLQSYVYALRTARLERSLSACLQQWRTHAHTQRTEAVAKGHYEARVLRSSLSRWKVVSAQLLSEYRARVQGKVSAVNAERKRAAFDHLRMFALMGRARKLAVRTLVSRTALRQWRSSRGSARHSLRPGHPLPSSVPQGGGGATGYDTDGSIASIEGKADFRPLQLLSAGTPSSASASVAGRSSPLGRPAAAAGAHSQARGEPIDAASGHGNGAHAQGSLGSRNNPLPDPSTSRVQAAFGFTNADYA